MDRAATSIQIISQAAYLLFFLLMLRQRECGRVRLMLLSLISFYSQLSNKESKTIIYFVV